MRLPEIIGIDIGGTKTSVSFLPRGRPVRELHRFATGRPRPTLDEIARVIVQHGPGRSPVFGIACGGPLDAARGLVLSPPNLPGWDRVRVTKFFADRFGGRAFLMNDANANALAEWRFGAGRGCRSRGHGVLQARPWGRGSLLPASVAQSVAARPVIQDGTALHPR